MEHLDVVYASYRLADRASQRDNPFSPLPHSLYLPLKVSQPLVSG